PMYPRAHRRPRSRSGRPGGGGTVSAFSGLCIQSAEYAVEQAHRLHRLERDACPVAVEQRIGAVVELHTDEEAMLIHQVVPALQFGVGEIVPGKRADGAVL